MLLYKHTLRLKICWLNLPCEQRLLCYMASSVYEVVRLACLSRSWFVYVP